MGLLMNSELLKLLKEEQARLKKYAQEAQERLAKAPEGSLRISSGHGKPRYYRVTEKHDTSGTYLNKDQYFTAQALAQKAYDKALLKSITADEKLIDKLVANNASVDSLDAVFEGLTEERKKLVLPYEMSDEDYCRIWSGGVYTRLEPPEEGKALHTSRGEAVRSKSEVIIANILYDLGIPYRYEQELNLPRFGKVHPDFTVLKMPQRETVIWEHFGMMDDPEYCAQTLRKISAYERAGYLPGKTLITTFESASVPLDARVVKVLAEDLLA